jgi:hypothetical protein
MDRRPRLDFWPRRTSACRCSISAGMEVFLSPSERFPLRHHAFRKAQILDHRHCGDASLRGSKGTYQYGPTRLRQRLKGRGASSSKAIVCTRVLHRERNYAVEEVPDAMVRDPEVIHSNAKSARLPSVPQRVPGYYRLDFRYLPLCNVRLESDDVPFRKHR